MFKRRLPVLGLAQVWLKTSFLVIRRLVAFLISSNFPFHVNSKAFPSIRSSQGERYSDRKWNFAPIHCTSLLLAEIQTFHYAVTRPWRGQSKPRYSTAWKIGRFDNIPPVGVCDSCITATTKGKFHLREVWFFRVLFCRFYASPIKLASFFFFLSKCGLFKKTVFITWTNCII